jgi:pyruvate,orthophosphate dikinase
VRRETTPEDIRGMHAAAGVLTERGGMTSHAAVIARGLGLPCVVGRSRGCSSTARTLTCAADGRKVFHEGDIITVDGTSGEVLAGAAEMLEPALGGAFRTLMDWADAARDIGVRANADTPEDARWRALRRRGDRALPDRAHVLRSEDRLTVMREMIFADERRRPRGALERLLPMQRADFIELFEIMQGKPVCIRLFDPPLHEFLPGTARGCASWPRRWICRCPRDPPGRGAAEFNPMLGMRGVRLGMTVPEIYEMQARAIFEATIARRSGRRWCPRS